MPSTRISGAKLDSFWQQVREPAFWLSPDLRVIWINRAWEELTGYSAEAVAGLVCHAHGPSRLGDLEGLGGSLYPPPEALAGRAASLTTLIVHAGGERRWRRIEYWPFHDGQGDLVGLLGLVTSAEQPPQAPEAESQRLRTELLEVRDRLLARNGFDTLIGQGPFHRRMLDQVAAAAASTVPVLIQGEPGTGKRLIGRIIHQRSANRLLPILPFDCAALPPEVLEHELFASDGQCQLSLPDGMTLLIGDILELPRDLQARLAQSLDGHVRLVATTAGDLEAAQRDGRLRADLYCALTTLVIRVSPLRERLEELPILAQHLLERANARGGRQRSGFREETLSALAAYDWPGNLRELARVIDEAHSEGSHDLVSVDDLPAAVRGNLGAAYSPPPLPPAITPLDELLTQVERRLIETALFRSRHNKSRAAELLGISRPRLYRRIKELNLPDVPEPVDEVHAGNGSRTIDAL